MTGAESDRRHDQAVDGDRMANETMAKAEEGPGTNALERLYREHGQSPWVDFIDRDLIASGKLERFRADGIRGLTSNPTIFAKAVASGQYDGLIRERTEAGDGPRAIYEAIVLGDVRDAADVLRPLYDQADGADGFVSIEVEPELAHDTQATIARARELWTRVDRPNVFIKIPATPAGIPAVEQAIGEGINVNITLMFSVEVYRGVARAYIAGLRRRAERGEQVRGIASVASFFVSRVDTKVDERLKRIGSDAARRLAGQAAIANAKLAYEAFDQLFDGQEFAALGEAGARVQRCLWASTSTKNPDYRDVLYVEQLIGPDTVDTMPLDTIAAFLDHGRVQRTLDRDVGEARDVIRRLGELGIDIEEVATELTAEGVESFAKSFDELMQTIESQRKALAPA